MAVNTQCRIRSDVHILSAVNLITLLKAANGLLGVDVPIHNITGFVKFYRSMKTWFRLLTQPPPTL